MSSGQSEETDVTTNSQVLTNSRPDGVQMKSDGENQGDQSQQPGDVDEKQSQCGLGSWRPRYLQPFANMWCFTAALCIMSVLGSANFAYYVAVITQIERRFGLSSQTTGFIKNIDNIGFMLSVLVVSHLGRYSNKPVILAVSSLVSGIAIFTFAIPHFIYGGPGANQRAALASWNASSTVERRRSSRYEVCDGVDESLDDPSGCSSRSMLLEFNEGALALFVIAELLQGMANSPKPIMSITYVDDNARERSPMYFGIMFGMRSFAPMIGFAMGAWTNSLYVDLTDPGIEKRDPRWIGAWWLGFVICGVCTVAWALPLLIFPPKIPGTQSPSGADRDKNVLNNMKDLPRACWRLLSNPLYLTLTISLCFGFSMSGYTTFLPKYIQFHFNISASVASVYAGAMMAVAWTIGPFVGGPIATRLTTSIPRTLAVIACIHVVVCLGFAVAMFISCPAAPWAGHVTHDGLMPSLTCNGNCSCDPMSFTPVCGSDGRNYFSPCYAGCQTESSIDNTTTFLSCQCIEDGRATSGLCPKQCASVYVFVVLVFFTFLLTSTMVVSYITVLLRCVDDKDKSMAVALATCVSNLAAFPAPMIYGSVIDSTCLVLQQSCTRKGACLLYDHDSFRFRLHLLPLCTQLVTVCLQATAWYISRRREKAATDSPISHRDDTAGDGKTVALTDGELATHKETII